MPLRTHTGCTILPYDRRTGRVLIARRSASDRLYPGMWETIGGSVEEGETLEECIRREVREEIGCRVENLEPFRVYETLSGDDRYLSNVFTGTVRGRLRPNPHEVQEVRWILPDEVGSIE
ncbi:MAG TPA: NUDIX domain-containing protein, partial [Spirochaetia bacterium]|nr:NUDIX domain-containing protein [Spirochaetia bacterium]